VLSIGRGHYQSADGRSSATLGDLECERSVGVFVAGSMNLTARRAPQEVLFDRLEVSRPDESTSHLIDTPMSPSFMSSDQ